MQKLSFLLLLSLSCLADSALFDWNLIPLSRRGRDGLKPEEPSTTAPAIEENAVASLRVNSNPDKGTSDLKSLIEAVLANPKVEVEEKLPLPSSALPHSPMFQLKPRVEEAEEDMEPIMVEEEDLDEPEQPAAVSSMSQESPDEYNRKYGYEKQPSTRNVDSPLNGFGPQMLASLQRNPPKSKKPLPFPQLAAAGKNRVELRQQQDVNGSLPDSSDDEVRCIPKVMQVEETVYDRSVTCHHSYQEKCHLTYITDYRSTSEQKCETTFKKNCHITFKPMPFNETVKICNTPVVRQCGSSPVGPEICSTHYETNCETRYKQHEVEQDEPVCEMEVMKKCQNITLPFPADFDPNSTGGGADSSNNNNNNNDNNNNTAPVRRFKRQTNDSNTTTTTEASSSSSTLTSNSDPSLVEPSEVDPNLEPPTEPSVQPAPNPGGLTLDQNCEEWPIQKCRLEKRVVTKVNPETACKNIPRMVCVPNNCAMVPGAEVCREEDRLLIQNVPQEDCELQPEENCHMEAVLVPRLVQKPNCVKVPKEICVNTKNNPRRVKKPIIKEWCYRPKDLLENPGTFPQDILSMVNATAEGRFPDYENNNF